MSAVLLASRSVGADRLLLAAVASFMDWEGGEAYVKVRTLAHASRYSERQVQLSLRRLRTAGELVVRERPGTTHLYSLRSDFVELVERLKAGEKDLWEKFSTRGADGLHPKRCGGGADGLHPRGAYALHPGGADGLHPNSNSTVVEQSGAEADVDNKGKAQQMARRLRQAGVSKARATTQLQELVERGAAFEDVLSAIASAQGSAGDPFAYGVQVLVNRLRIHDTVKSESCGWGDAPRSVVEARGVELGLGKWDQLAEQWPMYKARVTEASKRAAGVTA